MLFWGTVAEQFRSGGQSNNASARVVSGLGGRMLRSSCSEVHFRMTRRGHVIHCWKDETAAERRKSDEELAHINALLEPAAKVEWELLTDIRRMGLQKKGGRKPT